MSYIRGQERLVARNVGVYLFNQLNALGWFAVDAPFGAVGPLHLLDHVPAKHEVLQPNSLAFTAGPAAVDAEGELGCSGGGLWETHHVFFCDIYGETQGVADALVADVRAILTGRLAGTNRYQNFWDYTQTPAVVASGHLLHFEDVETETPEDQSYKRTWRIVKLTAIHEYNAVEGLPAIPMTLLPSPLTYPGPSLYPTGP